MVFMVLAAVDRAVLNNKLGLGPELEKGLETMGPLLLAMGGIMCAAPLLGNVLGGAVAPLYRAIGCDPALFGGMFFGMDMGGFALASQMTDDPEIVLLSGVQLASALGCSITFSIPVGLVLIKGRHREAAAKGIVISMIAAPVSAVVGGMVGGISMLRTLRLIYPAVIESIIIALFLTLLTKPTLKFFLGLSKVLSGFCVLVLAIATIDDLLGLTIIPGLAPLSEQLVLIGEISVTLAGAYPLIAFLKKVLAPVMHSVAVATHLDDTSVLGMFVALANPMPMYALTPEMTLRGTVVCYAFTNVTSAAFGDFLGFITAMAPQYTMPMIIGKMASGVVALALSLLMTRGETE